MSDVELLFLVLGLIYAWECANWVPARGTAFTTWLGSRWHHSSPVLRNQKGGFVFTAILPPLGGILGASPVPVLAAPQGIVATRLVSRSQKVPACLSWNDVKTIGCEGKSILVNGKAFARGFSVIQARRTADQLKELSKLSPAAREGALQKGMQDRFRVKTATQLWKAFALRTVNLQFLANALLLYLFLFAPVAIWRMGLPPIWPSLLAGLYVLTFSIAFIFHSTHKHFYPAAKDERFTHTLINMFSPATTIRARDVLSRPLLEEFHPVAIAKAFCADAEFKEFAREAIRDFRFPLPPTGLTHSGPEQVIVKYCRDLEQKALEGFLQKHGLKLDDLLRAPDRMDDTCLAYCPRCSAQYTFTDGECGDCRTALVAFPGVTKQKPEGATAS